MSMTIHDEMIMEFQGKYSGLDLLKSVDLLKEFEGKKELKSITDLKRIKNNLELFVNKDNPKLVDMSFEMNEIIDNYKQDKKTIPKSKFNSKKELQKASDKIYESYEKISGVNLKYGKQSDDFTNKYDFANKKIRDNDYIIIKDDSDTLVKKPKPKALINAYNSVKGKDLNSLKKSFESMIKDNDIKKYLVSKIEGRLHNIKREIENNEREDQQGPHPYPRKKNNLCGLDYIEAYKDLNILKKQLKNHISKNDSERFIKDIKTQAKENFQSKQKDYVNAKKLKEQAKRIRELEKEKREKAKQNKQEKKVEKSELSELKKRIKELEKAPINLAIIENLSNKLEKQEQQKKQPLKQERKEMTKTTKETIKDLAKELENHIDIGYNKVNLTHLVKNEIFDTKMNNEMKKLLTNNTYKDFKQMDAKIELNKKQLQALNPNFKEAFNSPFMLILTGGLVAFKGEYQNISDLYFANKKYNEISELDIEKVEDSLNNSFKNNLERVGLDKNLSDLMPIKVENGEIIVEVKELNELKLELDKTIEPIDLSIIENLGDKLGKQEQEKIDKEQKQKEQEKKEKPTKTKIRKRKNKFNGPGM